MYRIEIMFVYMTTCIHNLKYVLLNIQNLTPLTASLFTDGRSDP